LGLSENDLGEHIRWMNAGTWQLLIPLNSREAVMRVQGNAQLLRDTSVDAAHTNAYVWFEENGTVTSRYFFDINGACIEDPGTGSACANLGAWAHLHGHVSTDTPLNWDITQAQAINRPNHLYLHVNADGEIQVGGRVMVFAQGELNAF
jgi:PhzF family phenazine biosynthesis protein